MHVFFTPDEITALSARQACALPEKALTGSDDAPVERVLPPPPSAPEPVKAKKTKTKKTQMKATGEEPSAEVAKKSKLKNKTQALKADGAPTTTPSLCGPDATTVIAAGQVHVYCCEGTIPNLTAFQGYTSERQWLRIIGS
jgi:hypothetical protein